MQIYCSRVKNNDSVTNLLPSKLFIENLQQNALLLKVRGNFARAKIKWLLLANTYP